MEKMYEQFGFLIVILMKDDENGCIIFVDDVIFLFVRLLIDELQIFIEVIIDYVVYDLLVSVCCFCDDKVWISSYDSILKLYNLNGKLLKLIKISLWFILFGIVLIGCSNVVFGDFFNGMLKIVKDIGIWEVIRL